LPICAEALRRRGTGAGVRRPARRRMSRIRSTRGKLERIPVDLNQPYRVMAGLGRIGANTSRYRVPDAVQRHQRGLRVFDALWRCTADPGPRCSLHEERNRGPGSAAQHCVLRCARDKSLSCAYGACRRHDGDRFNASRTRYSFGRIDAPAALDGATGKDRCFSRRLCRGRST
jgi:hypothetical protein